MRKTARAVSFLIKAPLILGFLFVINLLTSPGHWWVQWAALGLGIAWVISLVRVVRAIVVAGGLAAVGAMLYKLRGVDHRLGSSANWIPTRSDREGSGADAESRRISVGVAPGRQEANNL